MFFFVGNFTVEFLKVFFLGFVWRFICSVSGFVNVFAHITIITCHFFKFVSTFVHSVLDLFSQYKLFIRMKKKALIIGINYIGTDNELAGCISDATEINKRITSSFGYEPEDILMLTDETEKKPTKKGIEDGIAWLLKGVVAGDVLLFYYSGHG